MHVVSCVNLEEYSGLSLLHGSLNTLIVNITSSYDMYALQRRFYDLVTVHC